LLITEMGSWEKMNIGEDEERAWWRTQFVNKKL
jgi:hypothetical protein